jgi:hypothetical protein
MKKIYGHLAFYFVGSISKVGDEQFISRICKENSVKFPMSNTKVALKNFPQ